MTAGTLTGVSGAGIEVAGLRLPRRWFRRFRAAVVADARRQGLTRARWGPVALAFPVIALALAAWWWWQAVRTGETSPWPTR